jgi:Holliday junction DNA helicase RuvA
VLELKDKMGKMTTGYQPIISGDANNTAANDALEALLALGISRPMAEQAIRKASAAMPADAAVEVLIKQALKNI